MGEYCDFPSEFHDGEVGLHGKENSDLELRLSPPGESQGSNPRTRTSNASAVGWPPVASFRKNITSCHLRKQQARAELRNLSQEMEHNKDYPSPTVHVFVKVYVEGYPIGRKVDLCAYDGYVKLSFAINELFQCLLAGEVPFTGNDACALKKQHTLVYKDNEGDRILVGDVPWNMFVSTAKKLHVLKSWHAENES